MASFQPNSKLCDGNGIQPYITAELALKDVIDGRNNVLGTTFRFIKEKKKFFALATKAKYDIW